MQSITIKLGEDEYPGRLPLMPRRYTLVGAYSDTLKSKDGPGDAAADFGFVLAAAIGLCWAGEPLDCPTWRQSGRDAVEYGEGVTDALMRKGHTTRQILEAGKATHDAIVQSIPTTEEVKEAADPFEAPAETGTAST